MTDVMTLSSELPTEPSQQAEFVAIRCHSIVRRINEISNVIEAQQMVAYCSTVEHAMREIGAVEEAVMAARLTLFLAERHVVIAARKELPFDVWLRDLDARAGRPHPELPLPGDRLHEHEQWSDYNKILRPGDVAWDRWRVWVRFADTPIEAFTTAVNACLADRMLSRRSLLRVIDGGTSYPTVPTQRTQFGKPLQKRWQEFIRLAVWCQREAEFFYDNVGTLDISESDAEHIIDSVGRLSELCEVIASGEQT